MAKRRQYNPKRTVNSTFARETRKNAEVFGITASGMRGVEETLYAAMSAGLEPKHRGKRKVKSVLRKTSKSTTTKSGRGVKGIRGGGSTGTMRNKGNQSMVFRTIRGERVPIRTGKTKNGY